MKKKNPKGRGGTMLALTCAFVVCNRGNRSPGGERFQCVYPTGLSTHRGGTESSAGYCQPFMVQIDAHIGALNRRPVPVDKTWGSSPPEACLGKGNCLSKRSGRGNWGILPLAPWKWRARAMDLIQKGQGVPWKGRLSASMSK